MQLYLSKEIEQETALEIANAPIPIVEFLQASEKCGASQLEKFILHFLCVNNQTCRNRKDWRVSSFLF